MKNLIHKKITGLSRMMFTQKYKIEAIIFFLGVLFLIILAMSLTKEA